MGEAVVLVTGANRGIGLETCKQLAARGVKVIAASRKGKPNPYGEAVALDVNDEASVKQAATTVAAKWERIDGLVNNAAVALDKGRSILELSRETLRATLETNVVGALRMAQAFWPLIRKGGFVVNVSSVSGSLSGMDSWSPGYSLSKAALNALTIQLAMEGRSRSLRVNSVCPGWVRTDMGGEEAPGTVESGAEGIVWLALDAPTSATGKFFHDRREIAW
ncbi:MAG: SDR family NAD(P)-dependent oxidoreductase [Betaproteobacteria bacterium]|nr:SDR family NAD(P)-dependent oxidoreductase [Betaproteobacteria bacterium]